MKKQVDIECIKQIPIENITIINPRSRNKVKFQEIVDSIDSVGLKRPISVTTRNAENGDVTYLLICGQGRLEAFQQLGETSIPAIIRNRTDDECYLMSLVENLARRQHSPLELLQDIGALSKHGYSQKEISDKTGLSRMYIRDIIHLLNRGEERLLNAVERNRIPIGIAITIADSCDDELQNALTEAYEKNLLNGKDLNYVRGFVAQRKMYGKNLKNTTERTKPLRGKDVAKAYEDECARLKYQLQRADLTEYRLKYASNTLKLMLKDENFVNLMRAEKIDTLPKYIFDSINSEGEMCHE